MAANVCYPGKFNYVIRFEHQNLMSLIKTYPLNFYFVLLHWGCKIYVTPSMFWILNLDIELSQITFFTCLWFILKN